MREVIKSPFKSRDTDCDTLYWFTDVFTLPFFFLFSRIHWVHSHSWNSAFSLPCRGFHTQRPTVNSCFSHLEKIYNLPGTQFSLTVNINTNFFLKKLFLWLTFPYWLALFRTFFLLFYFIVGDLFPRLVVFVIISPFPSSSSSLWLQPITRNAFHTTTH